MINFKLSTLGLLWLGTLSWYFGSPMVAQAQTLTISATLDVPGLTFLNSDVNGTKAGGSFDLLTTLSFAKSEVLVVSKTSSTSLTDLLVSPAFAAAEPTENAAIKEEAAETEILAVVETLKIPAKTATPTLKPAVTPQPTATAKPTISPTATPLVNSVSSNIGGLNPDKIFDLVNTHRVSINLPALQKDARACLVANTRAPAIAEEISNGQMHSGLRAMNLPYWNSENIIAINSEQAAFDWWMGDFIHKKAIESDNIYSCVACFGNACVQEFTSFQPK